MENKLILGISGLAGTGKDSVCDVLVKDFDFTKIALADPMKRFCSELFDWEPDRLWGPSELRSDPDTRYPIPHDDDTVEYLTSRHALQQLGTDWARNCYRDVWVDYTMRMAKKLLIPSGKYYKGYDPVKGISTPWYDEPGITERSGVVISDCRFCNELKSIKNQGGKVVRIKRPGYEKPRWNHPSETEQMTVLDEEFDYIFHNDGSLDDIKEKVAEMMRVLGE